MIIKGIISGKECGVMEAVQEDTDIITKALMDVSLDAQKILNTIFQNADDFDTEQIIDANGKNMKLNWLRKQYKQKGWSNYRTGKAFTEIQMMLRGTA